MRTVNSTITCLWIVVAVMTLALGTTDRPASAEGVPNGCIQDVYNAQGNTQNLNCTANDVRVARVTDITPKEPGSGFVMNADGSYLIQNGSYQCVKGLPIHFTANFEVILGAQARYDIGLYVADIKQGSTQADAIRGYCNQSIITKANAPATYFNFDDTGNGGSFAGQGDSCGDISGLHNPQIVNMDIQTLCQGDSNGKLKLPNCTSWVEKEKQVCTSISQAIPGSPSKCNCEPGFTIDVGVVDPPPIQVTKKVTSPSSATIYANTPTDVTYEVDVKNPGPSIVTITSLTDTINNQSTDLGSACQLPVTIPAGEHFNCSFTVAGVKLGFGQSVTDSACASGIDQYGQIVQKQCATAEVKESTPPPSTIQVTKSVTDPSSGKIPANTPTDVKYGVGVKNLGPSDVTITSLTDTIKNLTTDLSSTCQLPATIRFGETYNCTFTLAGVTLAPGESLADRACAGGNDQYGQSIENTCADATVSESSPAPTASLVKSVVGTVCAMVTYQVKVINSDPYQPIMLSSLVDDPLGDLTKDKNSGNVKIDSTTCGMAAPSGPGSLPAKIDIGGSYTCTFNAYVCPEAGKKTIKDTATGKVADMDGTPPDIQPSGTAVITVDNSGAGGTDVTLKMTTP